jgi:peptide chain release factor subunit 1
MSVSLPKKHGRGGQSALRFARLRLEARHNYISKISELCTKYFIDANNKPNVIGLIIGGCGDLKTQLSKDLDLRLKASTFFLTDKNSFTVVLDLVDIAYGMNQGLQNTIELSSNLMKDVSLVKQKKMMSQFFEEIRMDSGKICYGVNDTLEALKSGSISQLIVWEDLSIMRCITVNTITGEEKIVYGKEVVPDNGWEIKDSTTLLDWLAENYTQFGCELELVQDVSAEGSQFCRGFGGTALSKNVMLISNRNWRTYEI